MRTFRVHVNKLKLELEAARIQAEIRMRVVQHVAVEFWIDIRLCTLAWCSKSEEALYQRALRREMADGSHAAVVEANNHALLSAPYACGGDGEECHRDPGAVAHGVAWPFNSRPHALRATSRECHFEVMALQQTLERISCSHQADVCQACPQGGTGKGKASEAAEKGGGAAGKSAAAQWRCHCASEDGARENCTKRDDSSGAGRGNRTGASGSRGQATDAGCA